MKTRVFAALLCALLLAFSLALSEQAEQAEPRYTPDQIDLDLAPLSATVVYPQTFEMMMYPHEYEGKVVRIRGYLDHFLDGETVYTACVVPDVTACCMQGIEFVWEGERAYPDDYPPVGKALTVTGRLECYTLNDFDYIHMVDVDIVWGEEVLQLYSAPLPGDPAPAL